MNRRMLGALAAASVFMAPMAAMAQTEVHFWHAFTGRLGELVKGQVADFNASQSDYVVVESHKGNYSETLNSGIAAFRAGEQPHILMVYEVGTATMMAAKGAIRPVYEVMGESGAAFDPDAYIGAVKGYYTTTNGDMLSLPFNSSTPVLWVNRDAMSAAGVDPDTDMSTWEQVEDCWERRWVDNLVANTVATSVLIERELYFVAIHERLNNNCSALGTKHLESSV